MNGALAVSKDRFDPRCSRLAEGQSSQHDTLRASGSGAHLSFKDQYGGLLNLDFYSYDHLMEDEVIPDVFVLCYSVASLSSLRSLKTIWKYRLDKDHNVHEQKPVILLALKRDLRKDWMTGDSEGDRGAADEERSVMPLQGHGIATELRCDKYMECSAKTGELMGLVKEDLMRVAVGVRHGGSGGRSHGTNCCTM